MSALKQLLIRILHKGYKLYCTIFQPLTLGAVAAVIDEEGRVLLARHSYRKGLHLIGGGVKRGESMEETICRELKEEVSLECTPNDLELVGIFYNRLEGKHDHAAFFKVKNFRGTPKPDNVEIIEVNFYKELPEETAETTRKLLELIQL